jgi:hypothetical protein
MPSSATSSATGSRFPAPAGWGRIPAWGYATVTASRSPGVATGARVFGFVPMASYVTMRPIPHPLGFVESAPHRADLRRIYNQYLAVDGDGEDAALVWRPLFVTSVLLDHDLRDAGLPEAVVLTSASSKTAYALAHLLRDRPVRTVGLTSPGRRAWVSELGAYDTVLGYDELERLDPPRTAVLIDFTGDGTLVQRLHQRLGGSLQRTLLVGYTHRRGEAVAPPPSAVRYSAPAEMERRARSLATDYAEAWATFAPVAERTLRIERLRAVTCSSRPTARCSPAAPIRASRTSSAFRERCATRDAPPTGARGRVASDEVHPRS